MGQLDGQVALITGAGSGIGEAAARKLAAAGAKVAALSTTAEEVERVADDLTRGGAEAIALTADVSQADQMQTAVQKLIDRWGRLDIVLANAGINGLWAPLEELPLKEWDQTLAVNLTGTFLTVKYALPHLKQRGGSVIITSSVNGTRMFSNTGATAYACSKAGQLAFTKMVALELAPHNVRVNCICPGWIESEIRENTELRNVDAIRWPREHPKGTVVLTHGKPGKAQQVADLIFFLCSDASSHITGTEMWIDGGQSLLQG